MFTNFRWQQFPVQPAIITMITIHLFTNHQHFTSTTTQQIYTTFCATQLTNLFPSLQLRPILRRHWEGPAPDRHIENPNPRGVPSIPIRRRMPSRQIPSFRWPVQQFAEPNVGRHQCTIPASGWPTVLGRHKLTAYLGHRSWSAIVSCCVAHHSSRRRFPRSRRYGDGHCMGSIHGSRFHTDRHSAGPKKSQRSRRMLQTAAAPKASVLQWNSCARRRLLLSPVQC